MDTVNKIVNDCKTSVQVEADLRSQLQGLRSQLLIEERGLQLQTLSRDNLSERNKNLEFLIESGKEQLEYLKTVREDMNKACLMQSIFEKVVVNAPPNQLTQGEQFNRIQNEFKKLLEHYESSSEYQQIIHAQVDDRKLSEKLTDIRNDLMKLETQKEY